MGCLKKIGQKVTLEHTGGRGLTKIPLFCFIKKGHIFMEGGVKIFLSHVNVAKLVDFVICVSHHYYCVLYYCTLSIEVILLDKYFSCLKKYFPNCLASKTPFFPHF